MGGGNHVPATVRAQPQPESKEGRRMLLLLGRGLDRHILLVQVHTHLLVALHAHHIFVNHSAQLLARVAQEDQPEQLHRHIFHS